MHVFITGGAGFVGCNLAAYHLALGNRVTIFDNLSRPRTDNNLHWLQHLAQASSQSSMLFTEGDIRNFGILAYAMSIAKPDLVVHLAAQVAVTTSVNDPRTDFDINALGTFNVLEAARMQVNRPAVFYASSNKVYGGMEDIEVIEEATRYRYRDFPNGIGEDQPLDFHSPYGCSKGSGDQYVRDYSRIYDMQTVVFRQSTIYGPRQFGVEDQGWLAHFMIATAMNRPIRIYGNGKQVRDMLNIRDLIAVYDAAWHHLDSAAGQVFNVGGGVGNTVSIWAEAGPMLESLAGHPITVTQSGWRPGDQPVFISDNSKATSILNWEPCVGLAEGMSELWSWVNDHRDLFAN